MYRKSELRNKTFVCWFGRDPFAGGTRLLDDGEGEDLAGAGLRFRRAWVSAGVLGREETKFAIAQSVVENDFVGGGADLLTREIDLIAERAGGGIVNEAAGDGLELAVVGDDVEVNELVVAGGAALGNVQDEGGGSADDETAAHASDEAVEIFFYEAGRGDVLDQAAGLKDDHFSGKRLPVSAAVFIVGADVIDAGRQRGELGRRWGLRLR